MCVPREFHQSKYKFFYDIICMHVALGWDRDHQFQFGFPANFINNIEEFLG